MDSDRKDSWDSHSYEDPIRVGNWWYVRKKGSFQVVRFLSTDETQWDLSPQQIEEGIRTSIECLNPNLIDTSAFIYQSFEVGLCGKIGTLTLKVRSQEHYQICVIDLNTGNTITTLCHCGARSAISYDDSCVYYSVVTADGAIEQIRKRRVRGNRRDFPVLTIDPDEWCLFRATTSRQYVVVSHSTTDIIQMETNEKPERIIRGCEQLSSVHRLDSLNLNGAPCFIGLGVNSANENGLILIFGSDHLTSPGTWKWNIVDAETIEDYVLVCNRIVLYAKRGIQPRILVSESLDKHNPNADLTWKSFTAGEEKHYTDIELFRSSDPNCPLLRGIIQCPACPRVPFSFTISTDHSFPKHFPMPKCTQNHIVIQVSILSDDKTCLIPVTAILPQRKTDLSCNDPHIIIFVYGSYGLSIPLKYDPTIQYLVNQGMYILYAHVRGGGERGIAWHSQGCGRNKINSVIDYLTVAAHANQITGVQHTKLVAAGASAGGTIAAAALNKMPQRFAAAFLSAPFISPLRAVNDGTNPRRNRDIAEYGDPANYQEIEALRQWSPLENICEQHYPPPILITINELDHNVNNNDILEYAQEIRRTGSNSQIITVPGASHSQRDTSQDIIREQTTWLFNT